MRVDHTQRSWALASLGIFAAGAVAYVVYVHEAPAGPRGSSFMGVLFGIAGFAFMIFAALLGARKRVPTWRVGRAQAWMRGHLWLGLLSLPLILFHGGFHFGGTLTRVLMWLLIVTVASGLFGAALQNYVPRLMTSDVPLETIYDEISNVRKSLLEEADRVIETACGDMGLRIGKTDGQRAGGFTALRPIVASSVPLRTSAAVSAGASAAVAVAHDTILLSEQDSRQLKQFYLGVVRVFLQDPKRRGQTLAHAENARVAFSGMKTLLPVSVHPLLQELAEICDEARQSTRQESLHRWLHGWLLWHIPLSLALIVLGAVHAVIALRY